MVTVNTAVMVASIASFYGIVIHGLSLNMMLVVVWLYFLLAAV